ncbi:MAG: substrate-binding domain-containing protein [Cyanobacteria bacterium P01_C01_bin.69]
MVNRKTASALMVASLLACAIPVKSIASSLTAPVAVSSLLAQAAPNFPVPDSVDDNTEVAISSSSDNMNAISNALKAGFEGAYDSSKVSVETKDANAAIQDVLNGNADLAAISRPLTADEKAKGLIAVPVRREKIAIVVGKDNPFAESLTGSQFAQIFRGEIKDWSEVGGTAGPIKLVDRPATSETRLALSPYPVFTTAPFNAAAGATTVDADTTEAVAKALGTDGISYILVGELDGQPDVKALQLHKTPPTDPRYPFSQPYAFVYAGGASSEVSSFLGYATGNPGQAVINGANVSGIGIIPDAGSTTAAANAGASASDANATDAEATDAPDADGEDSTDDAATEGTTPEDEAGDTTAEGAAPDGTTIEASNVAIAGLDGELGTADDINIAGPDGVLGTADDIRGVGPDGEIGTADDIDLVGPDGVPGTADDVNIAGPDGEAGTADDIAFAGAADAGAGGFGSLLSNGRWWWLLLPLAGLGLLIWAAGKQGNEEEAGYIANAEGNDIKASGGGDRIRSSIDGDPSFGSGPNAGLDGVDGDVSGAQVSGKGLGIGKVAAGGAAIAGGAAVAGKGLASRVKSKAGDVTMDLQDGVSGSMRGGVDGVKGGLGGLKGKLQGGVDGLKSGVSGGVDGIKGGVTDGIDGVSGSVQSGIDGAKSGVQGSIDGLKDGISGGVDGLKGNVQGSIDGSKGGIQGGIDGIKGAGAAGLGVGAAGLGAAGAGLAGLRDKAQDGIDTVKGSAQEGVDDVKGDAGDAISWLDRAKQRINEATDQVKDAASEAKDDLTND